MINGIAQWTKFGLAWLIVVSAGAEARTVAQAEEPIGFRDGDRVVLLGDGLIEQAQYSGWVELMLTTGYSEFDLTFRNLGWSGDTPGGASRLGLSPLQAGREPEGEAWKQLRGQLELTRPTVLIAGYGMASALDPTTGIEEFKTEYRRLLEWSREQNPDLRLVLLSPLEHISATAEQQQRLERVRNAVAELATEFEAAFVDLAVPELARPFLRKDPIHLNSFGYRKLASLIEDSLAVPESDWATDRRAETVRQLILKKNQWWFHRSRPANMAYVFGFRKHEQGQNADEIPAYDQLVAREERMIRRLRQLDRDSTLFAAPQFESQFAEFQPQPHPEFTVPDDWEVTLWAENPSLNKPIQMNFDPQGRLWVASSEAYPMIEVGQSPPDRILVLEDTNGDGQADQSTVFADGLLIPTGVIPGDGGAYVAQSTDLLFLQDTDGDGRADLRRRVLSGFGTEDTHHNLHTLRWGVDGRLYMNQSVYTRTDAETPHGVVRLRAGGGFRLNPSTMRMDIFFRGLWNSWGHQVDAWNQSFLTDGAGFSGVAYAFPGAAFRPIPGSGDTLDLISPGNWPKFCSAEIIEGPSFPPDWQHSLITCDFRANRVTRFEIEDQGAGFVTQAAGDLMRTGTATFRPIDVKVGPDGALYVADWSNPIINHGEVDFRDPRRDRWHGRIWRLKWKPAAEKAISDLNTRADAELLDLLASPDRYDRDQARRVLIERGEKLDPAWSDWITAQSAPEHRLQGLWLQQARGEVAADLLIELLHADDGRIRTAATRVLGDLVRRDAAALVLGSPEQVVEQLALRIKDSFARARIEAIRALAAASSLPAMEAMLSAAEADRDRFIDHSLKISIAELEQPLMSALQSGGLAVDAGQLELILQTVQPAAASRFLAGRFSDQPIPAGGEGRWIELIGKAGEVSELNRLWDQLNRGDFDPATSARVLQALAEAQRLRRKRPAGDPNSLKTWILSDNRTVAAAAHRLAAEWNLKSAAGDLMVVIQDAQRPDAVRRSALQTLQKLAPKRMADPLVAMLRKSPSSGIAGDLVTCLAVWKDPRAPSLFCELLIAASPDAAKTLWKQAVSVRGFAPQLADELGQHDLDAAVLEAGREVVREGGGDRESLAVVLNARLGGEPAQPLSAEQMAGLVTDVGQGDPRRGEQIYRRNDLACVTCHAIGGVGGKVGPDLTSIGASTPIDYLVESLFRPEAKIKEGYHSLVVATEDGQVLSGIEVQRSDQQLVLRNDQNELIEIPRIDIIDEKKGPSLMPVGVVDRLTRQNQLDLIQFLSRLGKPGEFDASQPTVARRFRLLAGTHRVEQQGLQRIIDGQAEGWVPVTTRVNGNLPRTEVQRLTVQPKNISLVNVYLKTDFETAAAKPVTIQVPEGASIWVDGQPWESLPDSPSRFGGQATAGTHQLLVRLDARSLPESIRIESEGVTFVASD